MKPRVKNIEEIKRRIEAETERRLKNNLKYSVRKALKFFRPPASIPREDWVQKNIFIVDPEIELLNLEKAPHTKEWHRALDCPVCRELYLACCTQSGKTQLYINEIGYSADVDPCKMLVAYPTKDDVKDFVETKLDPTIENSPLLRKKIKARKKGSDDASSTFFKKFLGGWAKIGSLLQKGFIKSKTVMKIIFDEVDQIQISKNTEGNPISNFKRRVKRYMYSYKIIGVGNPILKTTSNIWPLFLSGSQEYYHVVCPKCNHEQTFENWQLDCEKQTNLLGEVLEYFLDTAHLKCANPECDHKIYEAERQRLLRAGRWIAKYPERKAIRTFQLNQMCSSLTNLPEIMKDKKESLTDPSTLQSYHNNVLGLPFDIDVGERPDVTKLMERVSDYVKVDGDTLTFPNDVLLCTCFADFQKGDRNNKGRAEIFIEGWGKGELSRKIHKIVINGSPYEESFWQKIDEVWDKTILKREDGIQLDLSIILLDSGWAATPIYEYATFKRYNSDLNIWPSKGAKDYAAPVVPLETSIGKDGHHFFYIGVNNAKQTIYGRMQIEKPGPGFTHYAKHFCNADYFNQMVLEKIFVKEYQGGSFVVINKAKEDKDKPNEAFDAAVGNYAGMKILNADFDSLDENIQLKLNEMKNIVQENTQDDSYVPEIQVENDNWVSDGYF